MQPADRGESRAGLVLTGGGARSAYQVGVLKAVADGLIHKSERGAVAVELRAFGEYVFNAFSAGAADDIE